MNYDNPIATGKVESGAKRWVLGLGLLILILVGGMLIYKMLSRPAGSSSTKSAGACVEVGGTFDLKHNECKEISEARCKSIGGEFIKCGSLCRHSTQPDPKPCPAVCDEYCQL